MPVVLAPVLLLAMCLVGCTGGSRPDVVVYAAQDRVYAEPLLRQFETDTGLKVAALYDSEAVKTVGLANRLLAEREHPVADVFWGNEEFRTRQLAAQQVFLPTNGWFAFGWRSRRVMINTNQVDLADAPKSLLELTNAVWRGHVALAYPLFGTTATHFAALRQHWGDEPWTAWCRGLRANDAFIVDGNSVVARMVARGEAWIGLTDSDDFQVVAGEHATVAELPLNDESLLIPNTVGIVRNGPHPDAARRLAEYLSGPNVARALVEAGALEGADLDNAPARGLQPDWAELLANLEDTTRRLSGLFVR
ncbi:MAG: ABC transporter substrate-binding protein [Verrucomicrobiales bacterium]|nr:ABC transporter substrate-binding protein [Verrucomicrobiales bacterium]